MKLTATIAQWQEIVSKETANHVEYINSARVDLAKKMVLILTTVQGECIASSSDQLLRIKELKAQYGV